MYVCFACVASEKASNSISLCDGDFHCRCNKGKSLSLIAWTALHCFHWFLLSVLDDVFSSKLSLNCGSGSLACGWPSGPLVQLVVICAHLLSLVSAARGFRGHCHCFDWIFLSFWVGRTRLCLHPPLSITQGDTAAYKLPLNTNHLLRVRKINLSLNKQPFTSIYTENKM